MRACCLRCRVDTVHELLLGGCGDSSAEREFPSDKVYRRDDRGIVGVESFIAQCLAFDVVHIVLDAPLCWRVPNRGLSVTPLTSDVDSQDIASRRARRFWTMTSTESETAAELQRWIDRLSKAAAAGEPLELVGTGSADPADARSWGSDRCIPAAALRHVLTCSELTVDPRGLRISGARFCDQLDLAHIAFPHPLHLIGCAMDAAVDLRGAALKELILAGSHTHEVQLDGATITGDVSANEIEADGAVRALGVNVGGRLSLRNAKLRNGDGIALCLDSARITGNLFAGGFEADGEVSAMGAHVGGQLNLRNAKLRNGDGDALCLDSAQISADVVADGFEADGEVRALGAHIGGQLSLMGAKLRNEDGTALTLESASIKSLVLQRVEFDGITNLYRAQITDLSTDANPPAPLLATGWEVSDIHGPLRSNWVAARGWLETAADGSAQPWHALAGVYERNGEPAGARRLRFAAATKVTRQSPVPTRILRRIYGALVGYGYYPWMAGFWLATVVLLGTIIVATTRADFVPTNLAAATSALAHNQQTHNPNPASITAQTPCSLYPSYPCLNSFTYTLSALTPTFGATTSDWVMRSDATNWLTVALPLLKLSAWALTALLLAGVTGLLRKT
jgi:hypothetical protein